MKNILTLIFICSIAFTFAQKTPEKVGDLAFKTLKSMDKLNLKGYANNYLSLKMHEELSKDPHVEERTREEVKELLSEVGEDGVLDWIRKQYDLLKSTQAESQFTWSNCKFVEFDYELMERGGLEGLRGDLKLTIDGAEYNARVSAILRNDRYYIISIRDFRTVNDLDKELMEMLEELEESVDESVEEAIEESDDDGGKE